MQLPNIDTTWVRLLMASTPALLINLRVFLGWSSIGLGVLGTILPIIPGLPFLVAGTYMVGLRNRRLRWMQAHVRMLLRWFSRSRVRWVREPARLGRLAIYQSMRYMYRWQGAPQRQPASSD